MDTLARYLHGEAARGYQLGTADCMTLVADWIALRRGVDALRLVRGYASDADVAQLVSGWGGAVRAMGRALRRIGVERTAVPLPGDVAAVATAATVAAAIRHPRGWVMRLETGFAMVPADRVRVIAAWSV